MPIEPDVFATPDALGRHAARLVADGLRSARSAGRPYVLGCPGGRSAAPAYAALAHLVRAEEIDLEHLVVVMMDDYLVPDEHGVLVHERAHAPHSCIRFGREEIVRPLDEAARPGHGVRAEHLWFPDPADPAAYDGRIRDLGGVDLFLLASGASDGHIAFNPAGAERSSRTRVVELPDSTRRDNLGTFPSFGGDLARVPHHGVTVGIDTIADLSASVVMLAHGSEKGVAAGHLLAADAYDPAWPATIFSECRRPHLFLDEAAVAAAPVAAR
ncbi:glucosamine-6-phosphate deaminase [Microlunatus sagamiharensis]|uniref:Glucosamine-6-phosphate deaminase n=1 Tax=Microlunatus sagamiharensis TaxID=546874 RepID=A0A1H2LJI0_9ACTN|nr:6-phosphogluconolactonase [Microlunatus sagamiharensis]SDU81069.1 glucosamine-6-phosphate deaminase [Microlunatus sagamiharensis]